MHDHDSPEPRHDEALTAGLPPTLPGTGAHEPPAPEPAPPRRRSRRLALPPLPIPWETRVGLAAVLSFAIVVGVAVQRRGWLSRKGKGPTGVAAAKPGPKAPAPAAPVVAARKPASAATRPRPERAAPPVAAITQAVHTREETPPVVPAVASRPEPASRPDPETLPDLPARGRPVGEHLIASRTPPTPAPPADDAEPTPPVVTPPAARGSDPAEPAVDPSSATPPGELRPPADPHPADGRPGRLQPTPSGEPSAVVTPPPREAEPAPAPEASPAPVAPQPDPPQVVPPPTAPAPAPAAPRSRIDPKPHVVRAGENFWTISNYYYSSGRFYQALWKVNEDQVPDIRKLYVGTTILVPPPEDLDPAFVLPPRSPQADDRPAPVAARAPRRPARVADRPPAEPGLDQEDEAGMARPRAKAPVTYQVQPHDSLRSIAARLLGDPRRADEIRRLNLELVGDRSYPPEGSSLRLPEDARTARR